MKHTKNLQELIKGEVLDDSETLQQYSTDKSLFRIKPQVIVFPKNADDIKKVISYVQKEKEKGEDIAITPRSTGTDMTGGPLGTSIILEVNKHMNSLKEIGDDYAIFEPGIRYKDFDKQTREHGLFLPSYPASKDICSVGGMICNNSGGEKSLTFGKTNEYIEYVKMVLRDGKEYMFSEINEEELAKKSSQNDLEGEVYKKLHSLIDNNYDAIKYAKPDVSKNSAGYTLWNVYDKEKGTFNIAQLIAGSQGTLGIVTEAKVRLIKPKPHSRLLVIFLKDLDPLADLINTVLKFKPESFESYDDQTFKVAMKVLPSIITKLTGNMIKLGFQFIPEIWMSITGGVPKLIVLAEFTGDSAEEAIEQAKKCRDAVEKQFNVKTKVAESESQTQKYWTFRRESFSLLQQNIKDKSTAPFIDDLVVRPEKLPDFFPKLNNILKDYDLLFTITGHVGDGNFHIIPLMKLADPQTPKIIDELGSRVYELVLEYDGTITGEHNDGYIRTPYLELMYGKEITSLFEQTKNIFDPDHIFNPNKKVNPDLEFALQHLNKEKGA